MERQKLVQHVKKYKRSHDKQHCYTLTMISTNDLSLLLLEHNKNEFCEAQPLLDTRVNAFG